MKPFRLICACALLFLSGGGVLAEGGIEFSTMPKGCSWQVKYSNGSDWTSTYLGKKGGKFRVETRETEGNALVSMTEYDGAGLMTKRTWANKKWEKFSPFSCYSVPGSCSYLYSNADGNDATINNQVVAQGDGFRVHSVPSGGAAYPDETFVFGPYNLLARTKSTNYSSKIVRYGNCGLGS